MKVTGRFSSTDKRQFGPLRWARSKKARRAARRRHRQWKLETHAYWKHRLSTVHKLRCAWQQCYCERKPRQRRDGGRTTNDAVAAAHDRGSGSSGSGRNRYWKPPPTSNLQEASRPSSRVAAETYAQTAASNSMSVSVTRTASSGTPADRGGRPHGYWKPRWHPQAQGWTPHATHKDACTLADDLH